MEVRFDVKMTRKVMYNFLMNHTYRSFSGIVGILFGIGAFVLMGVTYGSVDTWQSILYLVFGVWFLLYLPVSLYTKAMKQVKLNPTFQKPITYVINEEGITTQQGEQHVTIPWEDMMKVSETKISLLMYTGKRYSFVLPKESMGAQYETVVGLIREHMDAKQVKIKG
jgi:hypothetical protein